MVFGYQMLVSVIFFLQFYENTILIKDKIAKLKY